MLLGQKLAQVIGSNGSRIAVRYLTKTTTFKDAYTYISKESYFLQNEIGHHQKVGVLMTNCPHFWYVFFGLANTCNTMVPFDPALQDHVIADRMKLLGCTALIISDDMTTRVRELLRQNNLTVKLLEIEKRRFGEYDASFKLPPGVSAKETDPVVILPTSGHAGKIRLIPITHKMIEAGALALRSPYRMSGIDNVFTFQTSYAQPFQFFHGALFPWLYGTGITIWDNPSIPELVPELLEAKTSRFVMKGSQIFDFLNAMAGVNMKLPTLRSITVPKGAVPADAYKACQELNIKILRVYGSVETCWAAAMTNFEEPEGPEYCGSILPGVKAKIVDYNGDEIPAKNPQIGQLVINSAITLPNYIEDKDATKLFIRGAQFYTGDWCELTKENKLRYIDRRDHVVKVGPNIISPDTVESILVTVPDVERAAVLELKDGMNKVHCVAVIQRRAKSNLTNQDIINACEGKLPKGHAPTRVAFLEEMPVDDAGVINKYKLKKDLAGLI